MPPTPILDPSTIDLSRVVAGPDEIRRFNPHRDHMEHLNAVVYLDAERHVVVGYKDVRDDEFWVSGHMPGFPILPGVIQVEAAAQLVCYYAKRYGILRGSLLGLGGVEDTRFRSPVRPGDRLVLVGKGKRVDRRQTVFDVQGFVGQAMAFHCIIIGVPIPGYDQTTSAGADGD